MLVWFRIEFDVISNILSCDLDQTEQQYSDRCGAIALSRSTCPFNHASNNIDAHRQDHGIEEKR